MVGVGWGAALLTVGVGNSQDVLARVCRGGAAGRRREPGGMTFEAASENGAVKVDLTITIPGTVYPVIHSSQVGNR